MREMIYGILIATGAPGGVGLIVYGACVTHGPIGGAVAAGLVVCAFLGVVMSQA